jgi:hypothetical protein
MKKKHTWANAIPKTRREKDVMRMIKNPAECKRMMDLLGTATKVTENINKFQDEKFETVEEIVAFVSIHLSDEFPRKEVLLDELNRLVENYEERILSREGSDTGAPVQGGR